VENNSEFAAGDIVSVATRTLLAAGYVISGSHLQPDHIEFKCERVTRLGVVVRILIAITENPDLKPEQVADIQHAADNQSRAMVLVSPDGGPGQLSWNEFLEILGGAVPSWRALSTDYNKHLLICSRNQRPPELTGEPWRLFEALVADGLEFCLERRVQRLGRQKSGSRLSDMIAPLPDFNVVVVDAKASAEGFDANWPNLRALVEYVNKQKVRQRGGGAVMAALVLSSTFLQAESGLTSVAKEFLGETGTPLCFMDAENLGHLVNELRTRPDIRRSIRWRKLFSGGLIRRVDINSEIKDATEEHCDARDF
jgi:hypothetical protein